MTVISGWDATNWVVSFGRQFDIERKEMPQTELSFGWQFDIKKEEDKKPQTESCHSVDGLTLKER